jgi:regulator of RNase E activity RraB
MPSFMDRFRRNDVNLDDRDLINLMLEGGEQLATRPRETAHYMHFESVEPARIAADGARAAGFVVEMEGPSEERADDWQVQAKHNILVNEETITAARRTLTAVAEAAGGYYDGWDTYADEALDSMTPQGSAQRPSRCR